MTAKPTIAKLLMSLRLVKTLSLAGCLTGCLLLGQTASGAIFRTVDANGNITFSDQPPAASQSGVVAEKIEINTPNTFVDNSPRIPYEPEVADEEDTEGYSELAIVAPGHDQLIRDNTGNVVVRTRLTPGLRGGHTLRLELNGTLAAAEAEGGSMYLNNLPRGTHRLRLVIENEKGRRLFESDESVFHMQRFSALLNPAAKARAAANRQRNAR